MKYLKQRVFLGVLVILLVVSAGLAIKTCFMSAEIRERDVKLSFASSMISIHIDSEDKIEFANKKDAEYSRVLESEKIEKVTPQELMHMIENVIWKVEKEENDRRILEQYGIYQFDAPEEIVNVCENVTLSKPVIFYNASERTWLVGYCGTWKNNQWNKYFRTGNLGDKDVYGIRYENVSGEFCTIVLDTYAYISDEKYTLKEETTNRSSIKDGFSHEFEDYTHGYFKRKYVGYRWYGYCIYDSAWERFGSDVYAYHIPQ